MKHAQENKLYGDDASEHLISEQIMKLAGVIY